jgi:DNA-binding GntR family transcriptional regulator
MFERKPLRADVGAEILGRVIDGRLPSGSRINESQLAQELGISRTPLREAMLCLTTEGALTSDMGRGFRVPHLAGREATDLLQTLAVMMPAALQRSREPEMADFLEAGNALGRARMSRDDPGVLCEQLYLLMRNLCQDGDNVVLRRECQRLLRLSLRYLYEAHGRGWNPEPCLDLLDATLAALRRGDRVTAADLLGRALRSLGDDLAARFPAEVAGRA